MTYKELYKICHAEAVAYAKSEQWSKRTGEEKSFLIQGYLDAMMEARKSEITEKKKEYPKTYEECCKVLGTTLIHKVGDIGYKITLLHKLEHLLIARDAYWKIAGEEMGLGKPWEPDYTDPDQDRYAIANFMGNIEKGRWDYGYSIPFVFPTAVMRDAFYENFKEEIEECKELL